MKQAFYDTSQAEGRPAFRLFSILRPTGVSEGGFFSIMKSIFFLAIPVVLADQLLKVFCRGLNDRIILLPGMLALNHYENTGMAFSLLSGQPLLLGLFSLFVVGFCLLMLRHLNTSPFLNAAIGLMLGGAVSNMIDRLVFGSVTDMIQLLFVRFAIFNLADACLVIGCVLIAFSVFFRPDDWRKIDAD